jgi:rhamnulokinase
MSSTHIAIDLGAESGRVIAGTLESGRLSLREIHRFPTGATSAPDGSLRWDIARITGEIFDGLRRAAALPGIRSVSADSWGVDYVWLDAGGRLLAQPFHYRDARNVPAQARVFQKIPREKIFAETGIQFLPFNTLFQLDADLHNRTLPQNAARFLPIADYINALLSGNFVAEESVASTTQLHNPIARGWSRQLVNAIGLPERLLPDVVPPATILSTTLQQAAAAQTNLPSGTAVIATCSHDTAAAVLAVPATETRDSWAYLSSGTWSLLGAELERPLLTPDVLAANFTNETGHGPTTRLLKNIIGLWLVQECRRHWAADGADYTYAQLQQQAAAADPLRTLINPDAPRFAAPGNMPGKIADYARETHQPVPRTPGETIRAALESLALLYDKTLATLENLINYPVNTLHIVGGGGQNTLLNQFTADATNRAVIAGPVEATAVGNILLQAIALQEIPNRAAARQIVRDSFPLTTCTPQKQAAAAWSAARKRFQTLPNQ